MPSKKPSGRRRKAPREMRDLEQRILATGCTFENVGHSHRRVIAPDGTFVMSLPTSTENWRTVMNNWTQFKQAMGIDTEQANALGI